MEIREAVEVLNEMRNKCIDAIKGFQQEVVDNEMDMEDATEEIAHQQRMINAFNTFLSFIENLPTDQELFDFVLDMQEKVEKREKKTTHILQSDRVELVEALSLRIGKK